MSIEDEKVLVRRLQAEGLTIQQIASRVEKSAYWVYSRLNDDYAPTRVRETAEIPPEEIEQVPEDPTLLAEMEKVRALRTSGLTFQEIADRFGRSVYWVHSRLRDRYQPKGVRAERRFQEDAVIPFLTEQGHEILSECSRTSYGGFVLEADVTSTKNGVTWLTEVKVDAKGHQFHTAIGQLVLHRALRKSEADVRLQIVLPTSAQQERLHEELLETLATREGIGVVFVDWVE